MISPEPATATMDTAWRTYVAACQHDAVVVGIDGIICAANKQISTRVGLTSAEQLENTPVTSLLAMPGDARPPALEETSPRWEALRQVLDGAAGAPSEEAEGVAKEHALAAREEAARKLITNHEGVLGDVTNPQPKTQLELRRVDVANKQAADGALREVARRLLGNAPGSAPLPEERSTNPAMWAQVRVPVRAHPGAGHAPARPQARHERRGDRGDQGGAARGGRQRFVGSERYCRCSICSTDVRVRWHGC